MFPEQCSNLRVGCRFVCVVEHETQIIAGGFEAVFCFDADAVVFRIGANRLNAKGSTLPRPSTAIGSV